MKDLNMKYLESLSAQYPNIARASTEIINLQAILNLPVKYKDVILLYYYQDMNQDEIAEVLQVSAPTVSRLLKRAQEKLRDVLKGGREDE